MKPAPVRPPIIDRPELVPLRARLLLGVLTTGFWLIWIYLWSPALTLLAWGVAAFLGWKQVAPSIVSGTFWPGVANYLLLALGLVLSLLGWAFLQYRRFHAVERRRPGKPVTVEELACSELTHTGLAACEIATWQQARRLLVQHDEAGRVSGALLLPLDGEAVAPAPAPVPQPQRAPDTLATDEAAALAGPAASHPFR